MIPVRIRLNQWWRIRGKEDAKTACLVAFICAAYLIASMFDDQRAQIEELEASGRAHSAALAALLNGRAIVGNGGTWAARCENVVSN